MMTSTNDWSYEDTVARVEDILDAIEGGDLSLVEVFERLEVVAVDLRQCEEFLEGMQGRADLLVETLGD
jgi:exodeoxyribonuclease VII small subunit